MASNEFASSSFVTDYLGRLHIRLELRWTSRNRGGGLARVESEDRERCRFGGFADSLLIERHFFEDRVGRTRGSFYRQVGTWIEGEAGQWCRLGGTANMARTDGCEDVLIFAASRCQVVVMYCARVE